MDIELYKLLLIAAVAVGASLVQSVTGFGFGIVAMIFLPQLLWYTEANVLSSMLGLCTSALVVAALYRFVNWKNLVFPLIGSLVTNYVAISFVKSAKNETLTLLLGIALLLLSLYFFFFSGKIKIRPTWYAGLIAGTVSGVLSGLFSIGGPPVVIYYLQSEKDTNHYMATLSAYFILSGAASISMKAASGFVTLTVLLGFAIGLFGMLAGSLCGKRIRNKVNPIVLRKAVYGVMAASGLINILDSLF